MTVRFEYMRRDLSQFMNTVEVSTAQLRQGSSAVEDSIRQAFDRAREAIVQEEEKILQFVRARTEGDCETLSSCKLT